MKPNKIVLMVIAVVCIMQAASAYEDAVMRIELPSQNVSPGDTFTANITVDPVNNEVYSTKYKLSFDRDLANVVSQTEGDFLRQDGADTYVVVNTYDNAIGETEYQETRWGGVEYGVTSPGTLASVTFNVTGNTGNGSLNFSCTMMGGNPVDNPINVTTYNATFSISTSYPKGDLNHNWVAADDEDVMLMLQASVGDGPGYDAAYDLNCNGLSADAGDVVLMLRASVGAIIL